MQRVSNRIHLILLYSILYDWLFLSKEFPGLHYLMLSFVMIEISFEFIFSIALITMIWSWIVFIPDVLHSTSIVMKLRLTSIPSAFNFMSIVLLAFVIIFLCVISERCGTEVATIRCWITMITLVSRWIRTLSKSLVTNITFVWLFSSMNYPVFSQIRIKYKLFLANVTFKIQLSMFI